MVCSLAPDGTSFVPLGPPLGCFLFFWITLGGQGAPDSVLAGGQLFLVLSLHVFFVETCAPSVAIKGHHAKTGHHAFLQPLSHGMGE